MKLKLKISKNKKMFNFSNYSAESKYFNDSNKLVVFYKMKVETSVVVNKRCVGLKPKMQAFLVDDSTEYKKQRV